MNSRQDGPPCFRDRLPCLSFAKQNLTGAAPSGIEKCDCSNLHGCKGSLGEESYIVPVASLATALSEQGHNI